ncbi:MAG: hypothetical protein WBB85_21865 [Albidovulum sp.]|uniref:hypothetical protein n=1 Tax=Albidovulum sp. TaxID=1872424 RepID=UPI003C939B0F
MRFSCLACSLLLVLSGVGAHASDDPWPTVYAAFEANDCTLTETTLVEIFAERGYDTWTINQMVVSLGNSGDVRYDAPTESYKLITTEKCQ